LQANAVGQGARPYRQVESILKPGTELWSGERVPVLPHKTIWRSAPEVEMRRWQHRATAIGGSHMMRSRIVHAFS
jgi:hypothetical protein